jgi:hypothetical protein
MGAISTAIQSVALHLQEHVFPAIQDTCQQILPIVQQIYAAHYNQYRAFGMPYGDTHEGFMRWMEDMNAIRQHQHEIELILQRHQHLIDVRTFGEKIRAKREQQ